VAKLHPSYKTPAVSLVVQMIWACILCVSGSYGQLLDYIIFAVLVFYILTIFELFVLRRTHPDARIAYCYWFPRSSLRTPNSKKHSIRANTWKLSSVFSILAALLLPALLSGGDTEYYRHIGFDNSLNEVLEISLSDSSEEFEVLRYKMPAENAYNRLRRIRIDGHAPSLQ
jgi:amino acid transporter